MSELAEKDAIREVMADYCFRLDTDRFADMAALFTEDGTWDTAFGKATGRANIVALVKSIRAKAPSASCPAASSSASRPYKKGANNLFPWSAYAARACRSSVIPVTRSPSRARAQPEGSAPICSITYPFLPCGPSRQVQMW